MNPYFKMEPQEFIDHIKDLLDDVAMSIFDSALDKGIIQIDNEFFSIKRDDEGPILSPLE